MHPNGGGEQRKDTPGAPKIVYSSNATNQYTVRLAAVKRNPQEPAHVPTPQHRADAVHVSARNVHAHVDLRSPSPIYHVPLSHVQKPLPSSEPQRASRHIRGLGTVVRWTTVTVGTLVLSTLAINAIDSLDNPKYLMLGAVFQAYDDVGGSGPCPSDMTYVDTSSGGFCIDTYEASVGRDCMHAIPRSAAETDANLSMHTCKPESVVEGTPWVFISRQQAELACAHAGKRLPSTTEWYRAALGTPDSDAVPAPDACNTEGNTSNKAGARTKCVSSSGAYDMVGNVWEWQQETVTDGILNGRALPSEGYVTSIDDNGVPIATDQTMPNASLFSDYLGIDPTDTQGVLRGGYWRSSTDAGVYSMNVTVPPSFQGNAVGFRCAKSAGK